MSLKPKTNKIQNFIYTENNVWIFQYENYEEKVTDEKEQFQCDLCNLLRLKN